MYCIIIDGDQENSDRESLPDLAPIPTLTDFPESPTQTSDEDSFETAEGQIF